PGSSPREMDSSTTRSIAAKRGGETRGTVGRASAAARRSAITPSRERGRRREGPRDRHGRAEEERAGVLPEDHRARAEHDRVHENDSQRPEEEVAGNLAPVLRRGFGSRDPPPAGPRRSYLLVE